MFANKTLKSSDVSRAGMAHGVTFVPARRATRLDPQRVLRSE
jgi:ABC-type lipoprotein release transport system permease subunit